MVKKYHQGMVGNWFVWQFFSLGQIKRQRWSMSVWMKYLTNLAFLHRTLSIQQGIVSLLNFVCTLEQAVVFVFVIVLCLCHCLLFPSCFVCTLEWGRPRPAVRGAVVFRGWARPESNTCRQLNGRPAYRTIPMESVPNCCRPGALTTIPLDCRHLQA